MKLATYIFSIMSLSILICGCKDKKHNELKPYTISQCAYCGAASETQEGKTDITESTFPSNNPPQHEHAFFPLAGFGGQMFWDGRSDATDILHQLQQLHSQGQLPEDTIKEWFSIDVKSMEALKAFNEKHNLKVKLTSQ